MRKCEQDEVVVRQTSISTSGLVELNRISNLLFPPFLCVRQDRRRPGAVLLTRRLTTIDRDERITRH